MSTFEKYLMPTIPVCSGYIYINYIHFTFIQAMYKDCWRDSMHCFNDVKERFCSITMSGRMQNLRLTSTPTHKNLALPIYCFSFKLQGLIKLLKGTRKTWPLFQLFVWYVMHLCSKLLCKCTSLSVPIRHLGSDCSFLTL